MGLDGKKDVHLDVSSARSVSRLEVLGGPSGRRVRSEAESRLARRQHASLPKLPSPIVDLLARRSVLARPSATATRDNRLSATYPSRIRHSRR